MDWIILIAAAFGAGVLNTIAGGGTFLTFPALVFAGLPPVTANATNAVAVLRQMVARDPGEPHRVATQLELFFDLVSVIALASATAAFHHAISYGHGPDLCNWVDHRTGALGGNVFHDHPQKCEFYPNIRGYFRD